MRIGCFFGTFDPPHNGHLAIATHMLRTAGLDQVWLVVTPLNPFKQGLAMVRLAVQGRQGLVASGLELSLPKPSYTADSLRFMRKRWPGHRFSLIIGSDNLAALHRWKDPDDILEHHPVLVYPREGVKEHLAATIYHGHPGIRLVADAPMLPISSTHIREQVRAWQPVDHLLPPAVVSYIREHRLYEP
jgi:nicotinate-nucleotide adenylyltransferase